MSNREDQQRTAIIAALSGVNERANKVDLSTQELVLIEGTYPALSGQQVKLPGKALLAKFDEAVYGIHQFWTPYGYGNNLYQFNGNIGIDPWITPGRSITIPDLPEHPYDDTAIVLDELGNNPTYPTGGWTFGWRYVGGGGGGSENGTTSTPGSPRRDPLPPPADYILRNRYFYVAFPLGGALRNLRDILRIYLNEEALTHIAEFAAGPGAENSEGAHNYHHPSGLYADVAYEILPLTPHGIPIHEYPVGVDPADQGGFNIYRHNLEENTGSLTVVTNSWN